MAFKLLVSVLVINFSLFAMAHPVLIFFGGHGSSKADMDSWNAQASEKYSDNSELQIRSHALPTKNWSQKMVLADASGLIQEVTQQIDKSNGKVDYYLAGHSSGSAIATEVARRVKSKSNLHLVILDGFYPDGISDEVDTSCWSARSADGPLKSINYAGMKQCSNFHELKVSGCRTEMCLHFALVNQKAPRLGITQSNYLATGFKDLKVFLAWFEYKEKSTNEVSDDP